MGKNPACALGLVLVLAIPASATDPSQPPGDAAAPGGRVLEIRVVERDGGKPIAGAAILAKSGRQGGPESRGSTDDQGYCSVPVPPVAMESRHFSVHAWKDGFVPVQVIWGYNREFEFEGVPASYSVILDRGAAIGGIVRDEQGRPVAGARVFPWITGGREGEIGRLELPSDTSFPTDDRGRWRCAILPASCEAGEMLFRVTHPRFLGSGPTYDRRLPIKDLRARSAVAVLETGYTLIGTVTDQAGRPLEGVSVVWREPNDEGGSLRVKSGAGGRFQFEDRPPGIGLIAAEAPGLATVVKQVELGPPDPNRRAPMLPAGDRPALMRPAGEFPFIAPKRAAADVPIEPRPPLPAESPDFFPSEASQLARQGSCEPPLILRLEPGRSIRGRVVDAKGQPIAGARITPVFRGCRDLLGWRAETGVDGRFEWANAPRGFIELNVEDPADGQEVRLFGSRVQDGELVVRMPPPFRLHGTVVDAETGRPIEPFRLIEGDVWTHDFNAEEDEISPDWSADRARTVAGGRYEVRFPRSGRPRHEPWGLGYTLLVIRIEAEGYAPAISRKYRMQEGEQTCDFALRRRPWIKGMVRAPDGSPVSGAEVVVAVQGGPVPGIYNGRLTKGWRGDMVRTGPDGRFAFAKPDDGGRIVIVSDRGLAQRTADELAAEPVVTLEPWGRIRGQIRVGTGIGARQIVGAMITEADYRGQPAVPFSARALTDAEGHFLLERVAPGHAMVYRPHWFSNGTLLRSHRQGVEVASGRTAEVIVGGTGRPVIGRVTRAAGLPPFELESVRGQLKLQQPAPEFPEGFDDWEPERQRAWWFAYYETEEGRKYYENANTYAVKVRPDGSFHLDDVPEGRYRLKLEYEKSPSPLDDPESPGTPRKVAVLEMFLDVPAGPDEKPLDLGTLTLTPPEPEAVDR
jgi:hypothetical protein